MVLPLKDYFCTAQRCFGLVSGAIWGLVLI